jgi:hypothetical protein
MFPSRTGSNISHADQQNLVWVGIPLAPEVLRHFLKFHDPANEMAQLLTNSAATPNALDYPPLEENLPIALPADEGDLSKSNRQETKDPLSEKGPFDEIRIALRNVNNRVEGYHSVRLAAEIAYRHFGLEWLDTDPKSPAYDTREKLRKILWEQLSDTHSNKSVPWRRFQDFTAKLGEIEITDCVADT